MTNRVYPQENPYLVGHDTAVQLFLSAFNSGTLHHGWLITGDEGIGKATLAYKIARFLLSPKSAQKSSSLDIDVNSPVFAQVLQRSHPDFKVLERDYTETDKKKLIKAINAGEEIDEELKQGLKRSSVIKVDDVRDVVSFLNKKSFNDNWRVVIVDSVDDLNTSSANALLKVLEEPPLKSILLLISHNPGRVLPTIRSRCATLSLQSLSQENVASLLRRYLPELKEQEVKELSSLSGGSIGRAMRYVENDALQMYHQIQKVCYAGDKSDGAELLALVDEASADEDAWALFSELICRFVRTLLPESSDFDNLYAAYENALKVFNDVDRLNMDKRIAALQILTKIKG